VADAQRGLLYIEHRNVSMQVEHARTQEREHASCKQPWGQHKFAALNLGLCHPKPPKVPLRGGGLFSLNML